MLQRFAAAVRWSENLRAAAVYRGMNKCCSARPCCSAVLQRSAVVRIECSSASQMLERFAAAVRPSEKLPAYAAAGHRGRNGGSSAAINALFTYIYAGLNLNWCWF